MNLTGKRVLLTGAGGGIGTALLAGLREAGAHVVACDRAGSGVEADEVVEFDITDLAATEEAAARIGAAPVDVLISNAGGTRVDVMEQTDTAAILHDLQLNFTGAAVFSPGAAVFSSGAALLGAAVVSTGAAVVSPGAAVVSAGAAEVGAALLGATEVGPLSMVLSPVKLSHV